MDCTNGLKETTRVTAPVASNALSVNVFTAPGKAMVGERPRPFFRESSSDRSWRFHAATVEGVGLR
jgi:hypothetical protein